jgi:hypothetical protein
VFVKFHELTESREILSQVADEKSGGKPPHSIKTRLRLIKW